MFQNEWDAVMTETFQLKMQLETTRKQVAPLQHQLAMAKSGGDQEVTMAEGITPEMVQRIVDKSKVLAKGRKGRSMAGLTAVADLQKFANTESFPIHQSTAPGGLFPHNPPAERPDCHR